jgi:hypothetical protein
VMEPHIHANREFRDLDDDDHVRAEVVGEWHRAYRLGPLGEDTAAYPAYLPHSISFSKPTVGASARTLHYGLYPPEDASSAWPLQEHLQAFLDVVLARVKRDIESWMDESADQRRFVTI